MDLTVFQLYIAIMDKLNFIKMNGLGNDFVILDGRDTLTLPDLNQMRAMADRKLGIGCDQIIWLEPSDERANIKIRIFNSDGGEVEACGNASRCIASLIMEEKMYRNDIPKRIKQQKKLRKLKKQGLLMK